MKEIKQKRIPVGQGFFGLVVLPIAQENLRALKERGESKIYRTFLDEMVLYP